MDYDFGKVSFIQEYEDGTKVTHTIRGDASTDEVIEAFEHFLKGAGYHLPEGVHIGYEFDEKDENPEYRGGGDCDWSSEYQTIEINPYNITSYTVNGDEVAHSQYYWDTERNK